MRGTGRRGTVSEFDEADGLGTSPRPTTAPSYPFHCIEIADGTRTIDVGTEVSFDLLAKFGRWEAGRHLRR